MALVNTSTYDAKYVSEWFSALIFNSNSLNKVYVMADVSGPTRIPGLGYSSTGLQADSCSWNAAGDVTLSDKLITPTALKLNSTICKQTLDSSFLTEKMRAGALNKEIPSDMNAYLLDLMGKSIAAQIERTFWNGNSGAGSDNLFNGIVIKASGDTSTVKVTGTTVTSSNVIAELDKVYTAIPSQVLFGVEAPKIYVPASVAKMYKQALASLNRAYNPTAEYELQFQGLEVVVTPLASNTMVAANPSNLVFGTDLISDFNEIKVIDMSETDGSDEIRFKARVKASADYKVSAEVVLYK
jgi:hypothetical protein